MTRKPYSPPTLTRLVKCLVCGHYHAACHPDQVTDATGQGGCVVALATTGCLNPACAACSRLESIARGRP